MSASGNNRNTNVINMQLDQNHVNSITFDNFVNRNKKISKTSISVLIIHTCKNKFIIRNNNYLHTKNKESKLKLLRR